MGHLYIPVDKKISGPWFLGNTELEELDKIFETIDEELSKSLRISIEEKAKIRVGKGESKDLATAISRIEEYSIDKYEKKVSLVSKDEKKLIDNSISGILKDSKLKDFSPEELRLEVQHGYDNKFSLIINRRFDGDLSYKAESTSENSLEEIKYKIETWIEKYRPNKFLQLWNQFAFLIGMIVFFGICYTLGIQTSESISHNSDYKQKLDSLLKVGVNNENQPKAIELLLKVSKEINKSDEPLATLPFKIVLRIFLIEFFILLIAIFYPKTTIGIGKHKNQLKVYKAYTKVILFSIPVIFFLPVLIDFIKNIFGI